MGVSQYDTKCLPFDWILRAAFAGEIIWRVLLESQPVLVALMPFATGSTYYNTIITFLHSSTASCISTYGCPPPPSASPRLPLFFLLILLASFAAGRCQLFSAWAPVPSRHEAVCHVDDPPVPAPTFLSGPRPCIAQSLLRTVIKGSYPWTSLIGFEYCYKAY